MVIMETGRLYNILAKWPRVMLGYPPALVLECLQL